MTIECEQLVGTQGESEPCGETAEYSCARCECNVCWEHCESHGGEVLCTSCLEQLR